MHEPSEGASILTTSAAAICQLLAAVSTCLQRHRPDWLLDSAAAPGAAAVPPSTVPFSAAVPCAAAVSSSVVPSSAAAPPPGTCAVAAASSAAPSSPPQLSGRSFSSRPGSRYRRMDSRCRVGTQGRGSCWFSDIHIMLCAHCLGMQALKQLAEMHIWRVDDARSCCSSGSRGAARCGGWSESEQEQTIVWNRCGDHRQRNCNDLY